MTDPSNQSISSSTRSNARLEKTATKKAHTHKVYGRGRSMKKGRKEERKEKGKTRKQKIPL